MLGYGHAGRVCLLVWFVFFRRFGGTQRLLQPSPETQLGSVAQLDSASVFGHGTGVVQTL